MNVNNEEILKICKNDFMENNTDTIDYIHLMKELVIDINDIGIDAYIEDAHRCYNKYQRKQKEIEKQELAELERLKKKYNK